MIQVNLDILRHKKSKTNKFLEIIELQKYSKVFHLKLIWSCIF